jgi:hypothetical protein
MMAGRELAKLKPNYPDIEIEEVDVVAHPVTAWNDNIRMVPAFKAGDLVLSGIFLSGERIKKFLEKV